MGKGASIAQGISSTTTPPSLTSSHQPCSCLYLMMEGRGIEPFMDTLIAIALGMQNGHSAIVEIIS